MGLESTAPRHGVTPMKDRFLLLAVLLGLLFGCNQGDDPRLDVPRDVDVCIDRMRGIYRALVDQRNQSGEVPQGSGVEFFAQLISTGFWPDTAENRAKLTCPGPKAHPQAGDFSDRTAISGAHSAYAGRDFSAHPVEKFPAGGPELYLLLACDNAGGLNHDGVMNALYSDGSVRTLVLEELIRSADVPAGTTRLPVGPNSPLEELRVLVGD